MTKARRHSASTSDPRKHREIAREREREREARSDPYKSTGKVERQICVQMSVCVRAKRGALRRFVFFRGASRAESSGRVTANPGAPRKQVRAESIRARYSREIFARPLPPFALSPPLRIFSSFPENSRPRSAARIESAAKRCAFKRSFVSERKPACKKHVLDTPRCSQPLE